MENMATKHTDDAAKVNTFENVWTALLELKKTVSETSKIVSETSKTVSDLSKNVGGLGNLQGRLTEAMFGAELWKKFNEINLPFNKQSSNYKFVENNLVVAEADFFLENGEYAMPVEIKTELSISDIDHHIERIVKIREYMDAHDDNRKLVGAIAGGIVAENALRYAQKKGLYVLTQNGDSVMIASVPHNFKRQEW